MKKRLSDLRPAGLKLSCVCPNSAPLGHPLPLIVATINRVEPLKPHHTRENHMDMSNSNYCTGAEDPYGARFHTDLCTP
jgi:hypothetical protein